MGISFMGRFFYNLEKLILHNFKLFSTNNERAMEVFFLSVYIGLQLILVLFVAKTIVSVIIIVFLFFLSLERVMMYMRIDLERKRLENQENLIKEKFEKLRFSDEKEIKRLRKLIDEISN